MSSKDTSQTKYVFITGGVMSGIGKGVLTASLGMLLQARGLKVCLEKFDQYLNVDPGTLNPYEHGECYVTDDGTETDLDLGHYERFTSLPTSNLSNLTIGRVYLTVIEKERRGDFLGKTVQVIPHLTDEIKNRIFSFKGDVVITEIGGTVGDIEGISFIEAIRQIKHEVENSIVIHLAPVFFLKCSNEFKTKPLQDSVRKLIQSGIYPDILVLRTDCSVSDSIKQKCGSLCHVPVENIVESPDASLIYNIPLVLRNQKFDELVMNKLRIPIIHEIDLKKWSLFISKAENPKETIEIGLVGKYTQHGDSYKSILEALVHAGAECEVKVDVRMFPAEEELDVEGLMKMKGIIIAPGFGERGFQGKVQAVKYAREKRIPLFGICFGMQCCVVEFARNVLKLEANSTEIEPNTKNPVIDLMEDQKKTEKKGGTMRLGSYECNLKSNTKAAKAYGEEIIFERHRHRYEFNNKYLDKFTGAGMCLSGINPQSGLVEIIEIPDHPWFIGVQFHPEYKSTVLRPHPLFVSFVKTALENSK